MSCSDKIAMWTAIGWQGSLLSLFIKPIFVSSIVVGDLFHRPALERALRGRLPQDVRSCEPEKSKSFQVLRSSLPFEKSKVRMESDYEGMEGSRDTCGILRGWLLTSFLEGVTVTPSSTSLSFVRSPFEGLFLCCVE